MISDFVKGKAKFQYSAAIQLGIQLHRDIDSFTDNHATTKEAKKVFTPLVRLYAGAFVDVVYDHFLANDISCFKDATALQNFVQKTYTVLQNNEQVLPYKFQQMLPYMQQQNWLYNYQFQWGIEKSFMGVVKRANYLNSSDTCFKAFIKNYSFLNNCYNTFIQDLKVYAATQLAILTSHKN
jgi:acyl carrier protein phosphodiesterase